VIRSITIPLMKFYLRFPPFLLLIVCALISSAPSGRAKVISIDFNNFAGTPPFPLVGQSSDVALKPWTSNGAGLEVGAGDLTVSYMPGLSKQAGTPLSVSGNQRGITNAALKSQWSTKQMGDTFWFSFLFQQPDASARVCLNINNSLRVVSIGASLIVASAKGEPIQGLTVGKPHLIVGCIKIDPAPNSPDTVRLWANPVELDSLDALKVGSTSYSGNLFHGGGIISIGIESYAEPQGKGGTIDRILVATSLNELKAALYR
jgi:hypothetical protein